jgi:hypothetical protein
MPPRLVHRKTGLGFSPAMIFILLAILVVTGCTPKEPPLSPPALAFKQEIGKIVRQMQLSLTEPTARDDILAIDAALKSFAQTTAGICTDCPYRSGVVNQRGELMTSFPKIEAVGRNFSSYKMVSDPLKKKRITQIKAFLADGSKIFFISVPLLKNQAVVGVAVMGLTPDDLEKKGQITEKEFLAIDFNSP